MNEFICLKEIEEPYLYYSQLYTLSRACRFCVLAENYFIVFKKATDIISLFRIPVDEKTKLEFKPKEFAITYYEYTFSFSHPDIDIITKWCDVLQAAVTANVKEAILNFYADIVHIDKIKNCDCPIVLSKAGYRLFIYESYDHQRSDICRHVINLNLYNVSLSHNGKAVLLKGINIEFKLTFESAKLAAEWCDILHKSLGNSLASDTIVNEIYRNESNKSCAECGSPNPQWVSVNICVTLCDNCVGQHRELGTSISRTQSAVMDIKCWNDSLLVQLLNIIGNDTANKFWSNTVDNNHVTVENKYKHRHFIDRQFQVLPLDEIVDQLALAVITDNVPLTMRLWFSQVAPFPRAIVDELLNKARDANQLLQEKFLNLQENVSQDYSDGKNSAKNQCPVYETVCRLAVENREKMQNLFLVCLFRDRILIKADNTDILSREMIEICTIYLSYLNLARLIPTQHSLQLSFYPECKFVLATSDRNHGLGYINITHIALLDTPILALNHLQISLFSFLLPDWSPDLTNDTSLFLSTDIQINREPIVKCSGHVTGHELVLSSPIDRRFDLTQLLEQVSIDSDKNVVTLSLPHSDIYLTASRDNGSAIIASVNDASKTRLLSLNDDRTVVRIEEMINFIKFAGLNSEGIFQNPESGESVQSWLAAADDDSDSINLSKYSVDNVACCLKKSIASLVQPLIPHDLLLRLENVEKGENPLRDLAAPNYRLLRHLIELLFIITERSLHNKMDIDTLTKATAKDFVSATDAGEIVLKYLIENLFSLFNYSEKEQSALVGFLKNLDNPLKKSISRMFYIDLSLNHLFNGHNFVFNEHTKLSAVSNANTYIAVTARIDEFKTVTDLLCHVFNDPPPQSICFWQYTFIKNTIVRRLLYGHQTIDEAIVNRHKLPEKYRSNNKSMEVLLFAPNEKLERRMSLGTSLGTLYRCSVKIKKAKHEVIITMPNSLVIYGSGSERPLYEWKLSAVNLHRTKCSKPGRMYIVTEQSDVLACDFKEQVEFQVFFLHVDMFRIKYGV